MVTVRDCMGWGIPVKQNRMCKDTELWNSMLRPGRTAGRLSGTWGDAAVAGYTTGEVSQDRGHD